MTTQQEDQPYFPQETYNDKNWMIAWTTPRLMVGPWPDRTGWSNDYGSTTGYCYQYLHDYSDEEIALALTGQALFLVSAGVPIETVLREFAKIKVWREMQIKLTTPGEFWAFYPKIGHQVINPYHDPYRIN